jgi:hypothetical protein
VEVDLPLLPVDFLVYHVVLMYYFRLVTFIQEALQLVPAHTVAL